MGNTLIFYYYAQDGHLDNEFNLLHFKCLNEFKDRFKKVHIYIGLDYIYDMHLINEARRSFMDIFAGLNIEFALKTVQHEPKLLLSKVFKEEIVDRLVDYDLIFFMNNLSSYDTKLTNDDLYTFLTVSYFHNLNDVDYFDKHFRYNNKSITNGVYLFQHNDYNKKEYRYLNNIFWINTNAIYSIININYLEGLLPKLSDIFYIENFMDLLVANNAIMYGINDIYYTASEKIIHDVNNFKNFTEELQYNTNEYNNFLQKIN